jgi:hypothetical protein
MIHTWLNVSCVLAAVGVLTYFSLLHCTTWFED